MDGKVGLEPTMIPVSETGAVAAVPLPSRGYGTRTRVTRFGGEHPGR